MTYTAWFDEIRKDDLALAGGKGANLGELSRAGLPVPLGFVVTTKAYEAFVESNEMGDTIVKLASMPDSEDPKAFEEASQKIHALFSGGKVPEAMAEEIRASYEKLDEDGGAAVAVRSSATAEDLAGASFAGQQETYLNVRGEEALLEGDGLQGTPGHRSGYREPRRGRPENGRGRGGGGHVHGQPSQWSAR